MLLGWGFVGRNSTWWGKEKSSDSSVSCWIHPLKCLSRFFFSAIFRRGSIAFAFLFHNGSQEAAMMIFEEHVTLD
jgi:hypothetical protein